VAVCPICWRGIDQEKCLALELLLVALLTTHTTRRQEIVHTNPGHEKQAKSGQRAIFTSLGPCYLGFEPTSFLKNQTNH
jgi:hypothetical protein